MMVNCHTAWAPGDAVKIKVVEHTDSPGSFALSVDLRGETLLNWCGLSRANLEALEAQIRAALIDSEEVCLGDGVQEAQAR